MPPESKKEMEETLDAISKGSMRSKIVRLREIFDKVEAAKANGASNKAIVEGLKKHGLIFDVNNFKNARSRILKERAMQALAQAVSKEKKNQQVDIKPKNQAVITSTKPLPAINISGTQSKVSDVSGNQLVRPPGITNAEWSDIQAKAAVKRRST